MMKYYVYKQAFFFDDNDELKGVYDTREDAEMRAKELGRIYADVYIIEKEETSDK